MDERGMCVRLSAAKVHPAYGEGDAGIERMLRAVCVAAVIEEQANAGPTAPWTSMGSDTTEPGNVNEPHVSSTSSRTRIGPGKHARGLRVHL